MYDTKPGVKSGSESGGEGGKRATCTARSDREERRGRCGEIAVGLSCQLLIKKIRKLRHEIKCSVSCQSNFHDRSVAYVPVSFFGLHAFDARRHIQYVRIVHCSLFKSLGAVNSGCC